MTAAINGKYHLAHPDRKNVRNVKAQIFIVPKKTGDITEIWEEAEAVVGDMVGTGTEKTIQNNRN
jgi:hypothetical protein